MVIVFSPVGTLIEKDGRPIAIAIQVLRELERLNVPLVIAADLPRANVKSAARAVSFCGDVISSRRPMSRVRSVSALPPGSFWWVSASEREMLDAQRAGYNAVLVDRTQTRPISRKRGHAFVINSLQELLQLIRAPYTRATLVIRQIMDDMFASAAESDTR